MQKNITNNNNRVICNNQFLVRIILIILLYVFIYAYLLMCVFDLGLMDF